MLRLAHSCARVCNRRFGRGTVVTALAGMPTVRTWATKFEMRSPSYMTRLGEVPVVGATLEWASPPATMSSTGALSGS